MLNRSLSAPLRVLTLALPLLAMSQMAQAFPGGAGTCVANALSITGMQNRARNANGTGPYSITIDMMGSTYMPGGEHMVAINSADGSTFTGLLIYAETTTGTRVGTFDKSDVFIGSPQAACPGDLGATASHTFSGPTAETTLMIPWTAPDTDVGPVMFRSIVLGGQRGNIGGQAFFFPPELTIEAMGGGEPDFNINQGIAGSWFEPATAGQGFLIDIDPIAEFIFIAWFTYEEATPKDGEPKVGSAEHRWLTAQGTYSGNSAQIPILSTSGGEFDQPTAPGIVEVGTMDISFEDCSTGLVEYSFTGGPSGTVPIIRLIAGTEALCEALDGQ